MKVMPERLPPAEFLRRRNALWRELRQLEMGDPRFATLLMALRDLTGLSREKILEGLGYSAEHR